MTIHDVSLSFVECNTFEQVLQVNLNAVWTLSRDVGRHMLKGRAKAAEGGARDTNRTKIINFASLLSFQGNAGARHRFR